MYMNVYMESTCTIIIILLCTQFETLECENELLLADMHKEDHSLRAARDSSEDLQHSIDSHNESIATWY